MPKDRDHKTVRVRNLHRTSRVNGIAPGAEGFVSEATAKRYPMYFARVEAQAPKVEGWSVGGMTFVPSTADETPKTTKSERKPERKPKADKPAG